jgi:hypothetical protein
MPVDGDRDCTRSISALWIRYANSGRFAQIHLAYFYSTLTESTTARSLLFSRQLLRP